MLAAHQCGYRFCLVRKHDVVESCPVPHVPLKELVERWLSFDAIEAVDSALALLDQHESRVTSSSADVNNSDGPSANRARREDGLYLRSVVVRIGANILR